MDLPNVMATALSLLGPVSRQKPALKKAKNSHLYCTPGEPLTYLPNLSNRGIVSTASYCITGRITKISKTHRPERNEKWNDQR